MKKMIFKSALLAIAGVGLMAGNAMATPLLNELTPDNSTTALLPEAGPIADSGAEAVRLTDTDGTSDTAVSTLYFHYAGYYDSGYLNYGIYDYTENTDGSVTLGDTLSLYAIGETPATTVTFDLASGTATAMNVTRDIGANFGFFLNNTNTGDTFYTHNALNTDGFDHALIYDTSSITWGVAALVNSDVVIAFEDLLGGGDKDYNDFVFGVSDVAPAPVPEPATMLLFGTGLAGLAGFSRRKKSKQA